MLSTGKDSRRFWGHPGNTEYGFARRGGTVDDRLKDWLGSKEPQICLDILNRMEASLSSKLDRGVKNFFRSSRSVTTKDQSNEAIRLFWKHEGYFHFLLSTEIWRVSQRVVNDHAPHHLTRNRESGLTGVQQPSLGLPPPVALRMRDALVTKQDLTQVAPQGGDPSSTTQERKARKQGVDEEKLNSILRWLSGWSCKEIHERTLALRQPDTCTWLPNMNAYKKWKNTENLFLWLHGKAGAGKSVLAASVIDALKSSLQDGEVLAYFYCDFRDERSTRAAEVMRSLLFQLLQRFRHHAIDPADLIDELIEEKDGGASTISNVMLLTRYISRAAREFNRQPFLVVDALDECIDVEILLDALVELQKSNIRLFVTSRPLQIIKDSFSGVPSIDMDMMNYEMSADIKLHVTRVLDSHRRLRIMDASLKKEINSVLCRRADGMFRWVQCQLSILQRCVTAVQVREALDDLPSNLNETYERILLKISEDQHEGKLTRRALDWLVVALVPLQLSQIMEGLSIDPVRRVLDRDCGPVHGPALLDVLGSLVTHDEVTDVVILSHFSVKEYLIAESTRTKHPAYHVDQQAAHAQVALLCMCYIGVYLEQSHWSGDYKLLPWNAPRTGIWPDDLNAAVHSMECHGTSPLPTFDFHSLDGYVLSCGFRHLAHINPGNRAVLQAIKTLYSTVRQHPSEWDHMCRRSRFSSIPWPTLKHDFVLYILIASAPAPLFRSFIGRAHLKPKDGTNPLIYAACFRKIEHARILLSKGVSLNHRGWDVYGHHHLLLPLEAAAKHGRPCMVDLFLTAGSPVPHELFESALKGPFILPACIISKLLQTDEFVEWAAKGQHEGLLRTLDPAQYMCGHTSQQDIDILQRRIVQIGYDPSTRFNEASLRSAVSAGHVSTVHHMLSLNIPLPLDIILDASRSATTNIAMIRLCLDMCSDVHSTSPAGDTPLHLALTAPWLSGSEHDCSKKVRALIDAGCNPSISNLAGETPLHLAVRKGYASIVEYLLPLHGPLPPDILLAASRAHNLKASTIHLLTGKGADVQAIAANGENLFHQTLAHPSSGDSEEQLNCVKALIDAGCNPCLSNANGKTPLDVAVENGCLSAVQYLHGTLNLPLCPNILLSVAGDPSPGATSLIHFLIKNGADIHVTQPSGDTLLHLAIMGTRETVCLKRLKILVNAGCDPRTCNLAGETPLHIAATWGYLSVVKCLLSLGISIPSDLMVTQLQGQPRISPDQLHFVRFLLDNGGDVHTVGENGDTLLHVAATVDVEEDALELAKYLVHVGCTPCVLNALQETPFHIAARSGFTSVIKYFCSLNIALPPNILLAASTGHSRKAQLIRYLVQEGASVIVATTEGDTPLHLLLATDRTSKDDGLECVKILIDAGCDLRAQNLAGETPLHAAARSGFSNILEYLLSQGVPLPHDILLASTPSTFQFLLGKGFDLRTLAANDVTELMHRALGSPWADNIEEFARILVGAGWDPSLKNSAGETAIHASARNGHIQAVKFFLSQNVPLPSDVLLAAVQSLNHRCNVGHAVPLTRFLIREGASVDVAASNGDTPLHLMLCNLGTLDERAEFTQLQSWNLVEILLNCGSDPSARNVDGQTPFDLAETKGHFFKENFLRLVRNARAYRLRS